MKLESIAFAVTYVLTNALLVMLALSPPTVSAASLTTAHAQTSALAPAA